MKAIITKLQDMKPLWLDVDRKNYIMKLETNSYLIEHSFFSNESRVIDLLELRWFLRENKKDCAITDLAASLKGTTKKNTAIDNLSKYSSYNDYLEYSINNEVLEVEVKKEAPEVKKISITKNVMSALLLAKKEISNILETVKQALDYSFVVLTALILSLFFSSKANLETNKDNKTTVLSYSKNVPSAKRFYFVLKLVNLSFITYLVTIKGIDNWFIG